MQLESGTSESREKLSFNQLQKKQREEQRQAELEREEKQIIREEKQVSALFKKKLPFFFSEEVYLITPPYCIFIAYGNGAN